MPGWSEAAPSRDMRVWRSAEGDALSLAILLGRGLPSADDTLGLQRWGRDFAQGRGGGLIEVRADTGDQGAVRLIYKRLQMPAYIFTGMLFVPDTELTWVWTVVCGERGTTGLREAVVTTDLFEKGLLTIEDYERSWAQDPYDPTYGGVDRRVLRFVSDDESYDEGFPDHPLSNVRRVLADLPSSVRIEPVVSER